MPFGELEPKRGKTVRDLCRTLLGRPLRGCASVVPEALSAPALEHVRDVSALRVHYCSYKLHFLAADTAGSV